MAKQFNLEPLEDRIVVKPGEAEETTVSGIVIPDTAKEKPQEGEVIAVGPGRFEEGNRVPVDVKVGDKVIYSKYGGNEWKDRDGTEYVILQARDIYAIITSSGLGSERADPSRVPVDSTVHVEPRADDRARSVAAACRRHDAARATELANHLEGEPRGRARAVCSAEGIDLP